MLYDNFIAEYYDASPIVTGRRDVPFYVNAAKEFGDPVLELGCGSGRVAMAIALAGLKITGLDLLEKMLAQAERKLARLPEGVRARLNFVHADMTNFEIKALFPRRIVLQFPLIIIPFRPFQHLLEIQQQLDCVHCARKHLQPGGHLVLDFFQTDARRMHDPELLKDSGKPWNTACPMGERYA